VRLEDPEQGCGTAILLKAACGVQAREAVKPPLRVRGIQKRRQFGEPKSTSGI